MNPLCFLLVVVLAVIAVTLAQSETGSDAQGLNSEPLISKEDETLVDHMYASLVQTPPDVVTAFDLYTKIQDKDAFPYVYNRLFGFSFIHHVLNIYFLARDVSTQRRVVDFLVQSLQTTDMGVDIPFRNDPHVLFKALMIREMRLATMISKNSHAFSGSPDFTSNLRTLSQLYSVACEPVPVSKLLLHADSIIRSKPEGPLAFGGLEGVKKLLASATPGRGAKPTTKISDLIIGSQNFTSKIVEKLGTTDGDILSMGHVIEGFGELIHSVHKEIVNKWIRRVYSGYTEESLEGLKDIMGHFTTIMEPASNRNILHLLAVSGALRPVEDLIFLFTHVIAESRKRFDTSTSTETATPAFPGYKESVEALIAGLKASLTQVDRRGLVPLHYALARYGEGSAQVDAMSRLYDTIGIDASVKEALIRDFTESMRPTGGDKSSDSAVSGTSDEGTVTGGWDTRRFSMPSLESLHDRCDIAEVHGPLPSPKEFFEKYVRTGTPVVFRNALPESHRLRKAFQKEAFVSRYGDNTVPISIIPYADSFGFRSRVSTMGAMADVVDLPSVNERHSTTTVSVDPATGEAVSTTTTASNSNNSTNNDKHDVIPPIYAFSVANAGWLAKLQADAELPSIVQTLFVDSQGKEGENVEIQFYLGPAGSGAPVHFHGHAVNSLAYGEKLWLLYPPAKAFYSTQPALQFVLEHPRASEAKVCTQHAGDLMFVPTLWGHATLNMKQSIGVAHEFSIESFCME